VVAVPAGAAAPVLEGSSAPVLGFAENADLVIAAGRALGLDDGALRRGVERARHDLGALRIWKVPTAGGRAPAYLVSAFAANDPESTVRAWERVGETLRDVEGPRVGLLSLRADRADRTLQWADALAAGLPPGIRRLFVTGLHATALERRVRRMRRRGGMAGPPALQALGPTSAPGLTRLLLSCLEGSGGIVLGFGNIAGTGEELVEHWSRTGVAVLHGT
jgi:hypothetical protein